MIFHDILKWCSQTWHTIPLLKCLVHLPFMMEPWKFQEWLYIMGRICKICIPFEFLYFVIRSLLSAGGTFVLAHLSQTSVVLAHMSRTSVVLAHLSKLLLFKLTWAELLAAHLFSLTRAKLLLWYLTVTCSCCPYLYFGSAIMLVTYFSKF